MSGEFRQDLFYRIQGACVSPPPLRDRSDRVWLAEQLLGAASNPGGQLEDWRLWQLAETAHDNGHSDVARASTDGWSTPKASTCSSWRPRW